MSFVVVFVGCIVCFDIDGDFGVDVVVDVFD